MYRLSVFLAIDEDITRQHCPDCFLLMLAQYLQLLCISQFQTSTSLPGLNPGNFSKAAKFPAPGQKIFAKLRPRGKKIDKNPTLGDILWTFKTILP